MMSFPKTTWADGDEITGAVFNDLEDRIATPMAVLREAPLNPLDPTYGGLGDNATNDTAAVAACLTAVGNAGGGRIALPAGHVFRTTQLTLVDNVTFEGGGTLKRFDSSAQALLYSASARTKIVIKDDVTIDGNNTAGHLFQVANGSSYIKSDHAHWQGFNGTANAMLLGTGASTNDHIKLLHSDFISSDSTRVNQNNVILHASYLDMEHCRFVGGAAGLTYSSSCTGPVRNLTVNYNEWEDNVATCLLIRPSGNNLLIEIVEIVGNQTHHTGLGDNNTSKGFLTIGENVVAASTAYLRQVVIAQNISKWFGGVGINVCSGPGYTYGSDITLEENDLDGSDDDDNFDTTGTAWGSGVGYGVVLANTKGFRISGHHIKKVAASGIYVAGTGDDASRVSRDGTISHNHVEETAIKTDVANIDWYCGIMCFYAVTDTDITHNTVKNTGRQLGTQAGIGTLTASAPATPDGLRITDSNRCYDDRETKYQAYGVRLGRSDLDSKQPTNCILDGNDLRGNATAAYKTYNTSAKGHRIQNNNGVLTPTVASASTILIVEDVSLISGTTAIATINGGWPGREIVLIFQAAASVAETGNVQLSAAFTAAMGAVLALVFDGTTWYEKSRSAN